jgi:Rieske 2Fe-2S family protein
VEFPPHVALFRRLLALAGAGRCDMPGGPFRLRPAVYCDPGRLELERERVFSRVPLVLGHAAMVPAPGDALALELLGIPLIVARGRDGRIRGFFNACRHRGARLLDGPEVQRRTSFVCPYHNWTYDLDGRLKHVPCVEGFPGLDPAQRGLTEFPLVERHGVLFGRISPGAGELDVDGYLAGLSEDLSIHGFSDMHCFTRLVTRRRTNWKLVIDAFMESYHVVRLHRRSLGKFFLDNVAVIEPVGPHARSVVARDRTPELAALPESQWDPRRHGSFAYLLFPNTIVVLHPDYTSILGIFPETADESTFIHVMLTPHAPRDEKEQAHWQRSLELIEGSVFQAEDLWISERIQSTLRSGANETLLYGAHEAGIRHFHATLDARLGTTSILEGV